MSKSIANGLSQDITVQAGQSIKFAWLGGTYTARIVAGAAALPVALATNSAADATFGPYSTPIVIRLTVSPIGRVAWDADVSPAFIPPGESFTRADDGVTETLTGVGTAASFEPNGGGLFPLAVRGGVSIDGNSLSANIITETSGGAMVDGVTYGGGTQYDFHWFHKMNALLGGRLSVVKNNAVGGSTMESIMARWDAGPSTNPLTDDSDVLFLMPAAINNVNPTLTQQSMDAMVDTFRVMLTRAAAAKKAVFVSSEWPVAPGWSGYARVHAIPYLNARFADVAATFKNVTYCDSWSVLVDRTTNNFDALAGHTRADFIHPTKKTAVTLGMFLAGIVASKLNVTERAFTRASPVWTTATGGTRNARGAAGLTTLITGTNPPAGWDLSCVAGPAVATGITAATTRDQSTKLVLTVSSLATTALTFQLRQTVTGVPSGITTGTVVFARATVGASSQVGVQQVDVQIVRGGSQTTPICARIRTNYAEDLRTFSDRPVTADHPVAAGITDLSVAVVIKLAASDGTTPVGAVFEIDLPELNYLPS